MGNILPWRMANLSANGCFFDVKSKWQLVLASFAYIGIRELTMVPPTTNLSACRKSHILVHFTEGRFSSHLVTSRTKESPTVSTEDHLRFQGLDAQAGVVTVKADGILRFMKASTL